MRYEPRPRRGLDDGGEPLAEERPRLAQVHHVEDHPLVPLGVLHREMEPEPGKMGIISLLALLAFILENQCMVQ